MNYRVGIALLHAAILLVACGGEGSSGSAEGGAALGASGFSRKSLEGVQAIYAEMKSATEFATWPSTSSVPLRPGYNFEQSAISSLVGFSLVYDRSSVVYARMEPQVPAPSFSGPFVAYKPAQTPMPPSEAILGSVGVKRTLGFAIFDSGGSVTDSCEVTIFVGTTVDDARYALLGMADPILYLLPEQIMTQAMTVEEINQPMQVASTVAKDSVSGLGEVNVSSDGSDIKMVAFTRSNVMVQVQSRTLSFSALADLAEEFDDEVSSIPTCTEAAFNDSRPEINAFEPQEQIHYGAGGPSGYEYATEFDMDVVDPQSSGILGFEVFSYDDTVVLSGAKTLPRVTVQDVGSYTARIVAISNSLLFSEAESVNTILAVPTGMHLWAGGTLHEGQESIEVMVTYGDTVQIEDSLNSPLGSGVRDLDDDNGVLIALSRALIEGETVYIRNLTTLDVLTRTVDVAVPTITGFSLSTLDIDGGQSLTISGMGFHSTCTVEISSSGNRTTLLGSTIASTTIVLTTPDLALQGHSLGDAKIIVTRPSATGVCGDSALIEIVP